VLTLPIQIPETAIAHFCQANHIRKLSLFGSILTDQFRNDSDVDVLIDLDPQFPPSLMDLVRLESELSEVLHRKVDLRTPGELSRYFRDQVLQAALPVYQHH
jgi:predicted nucleotidyltransferase